MSLDCVRDGDLDLIGTRLDGLGVNYYNPTRITAPTGEGLPFEDAGITGYPTTAFGWPVVPDGLRELLVGLKARYGDALPPVYVTENGYSQPDDVGPGGTVDDQARIAYLDGHIKAVEKAGAEGVDVRGYYVWSLLDNFEWAEGYNQRFGLVHVDFATGTRTPEGVLSLARTADLARLSANPTHRLITQRISQDRERIPLTDSDNGSREPESEPLTDPREAESEPRSPTLARPGAAPANPACLDIRPRGSHGRAGLGALHREQPSGDDRTDAAEQRAKQDEHSAADKRVLHIDDDTQPANLPAQEVDVLAGLPAQASSLNSGNRPFGEITEIGKGGCRPRGRARRTRVNRPAETEDGKRTQSHPGPPEPFHRVGDAARPPLPAERPSDHRAGGHTDGGQENRRLLVGAADLGAGFGEKREQQFERLAFGFLR